jgi:hypothetical protein
MTPVNFDKFINNIYFPDLANKVLKTPSVRELKQCSITYKYTFTGFENTTPAMMKMVTVLEGIFPKRCQQKTRVIKLKFTKNRCHSEVFLQVSLYDLCGAHIWYLRKPVDAFSSLNCLQQQSKYFCFPGVRGLIHFYLPYNLSIVYNAKEEFKGLFYFHKAALFD